MTPSTPSTMTRTITMRANCTSEHSSTPLVVLLVFLMMCHDPLGSSSLSLSSSRHVAHVSLSLILFTYLPFYFNLSFSVFFLSSVLMYPDLQTDLYNLDSVEITCATPPRGASTPTTSPTPSQVMSPTTRSPTTRSPTSSSTPRVPSPTLLRHRTRT